MENLRNLSPEEIKGSIITLVVEHQKALEENALLKEICKDHKVENRTLAAELGMSTGDLKKWLCAMGILTWAYGQGFRIHESVAGWGKAEPRMNNKAEKWQNFIYWNLKGHMEIKRMFKRWLADGNDIADIKQMKR